MQKMLVKSIEISQTIDLKSALNHLGKHYPIIWPDPLMLAFSQSRKQYIIISHYGVINLTNCSPWFESRAYNLLLPFLKNPLEERNFDEMKILFDPNQKVKVGFDKIILPYFEEKYFLIIGMLLNQSVGLDSYEKKIEPLLETFTKEMASLKKFHFIFRTKKLVSAINELMLLHQDLITNLGVLDKPDLVWEREDLDTLYHNFANNLELAERVEILNGKFNLFQTNSKTALDIINTHRAHLLELTVIFLILIELILFGLGEVLK